MRRIGLTATSSTVTHSPESSEQRLQVSRRSEWLQAQRVAPASTSAERLPPPPPPPPLPARGGSSDTSVGSAKLDCELDLGQIKQAALMRDIQKQESGARDFVEPPTNNRLDMLLEIQKKGRETTGREIHEPHTDSRSALLFEIQKQQHVARRRLQDPEPEPEPEPEPPAKPERQTKKLKKPAPPPSLPVGQAPTALSADTAAGERHSNAVASCRNLSAELQTAAAVGHAGMPMEESTDTMSRARVATVEGLAGMEQAVNAEVERRHERLVEELRLENRRLLAELDASRRERSSKQATMAAAAGIAKDALRALLVMEETAGTCSEIISNDGQLEEAWQQHEGTISPLVGNRPASDDKLRGHRSSHLQVSPRTLCAVFDSPLRERVLMIQWDGSKSSGLAGMSNLLGGHIEHAEDVVCSAVRQAAAKSGLTEAALHKRARLAGVVHVADFHSSQVPYSVRYECITLSASLSASYTPTFPGAGNDVCGHNGARRQCLTGLLICLARGPHALGRPEGFG